jgi:F-type H+-transporting ATPase subunit delta
MRGTSVEAHEELVGELKSTLSQDSGAGYDVAGDLFAVASVLRSEAALRRVLTDVSLGSDAKSGLVRSVFSGKLGDQSLELVAAAAGKRWAAMRDLGDTLEHLAVVAVVLAAEGDGEADAVEQQLFTVSRMVTDNPSLRDALSDPARSVADKQQLLRSLLEGKAARGTIQLTEQAVTGTYRTVVLAIEAYQKVAATERDRLVALVRVARPLTEEESQRLSTALSNNYGRRVALNELVDPDVLGGVRIEVGDDVIDGTVASRLDQARRKLAG